MLSLARLRFDKMQIFVLIPSYFFIFVLIHGGYIIN